MALTQLNQLAISFKKLAGKAHTNASFGIGNEAVASFVQLGTTTIFGEPIPTTSIPSSLYGINGPVEKLRFQLTSIAASQYTATNPGGLTGATINATGDGAPSAGTFTNGIHAYKLSLPSAYESNSTNPKAGTTPFTNSSVISDSAGGLQLIPDSFGAGYGAVVFDNAGQIFPGDQDDYYLDYSTGILFVQDIVSGQPPIHVDAYLYIGKYQADPTLDYSGSFSGSFQGSSTGTFTGIGSGSFSGSFEGSSTGVFTGIGSGSFSGSFEGNATLNDLTLTGSFNHTGSQFHIGDTTQTGSIYLTGSIDVVGPIISNGINVVDNAIAMAIALG
jgi:hypothetical protein